MKSVKSQMGKKAEKKGGRAIIQVKTVGNGIRGGKKTKKKNFLERGKDRERRGGGPRGCNLQGGLVYVGVRALCGGSITLGPRKKKEKKFRKTGHRGAEKKATGLGPR